MNTRLILDDLDRIAAFVGERIGRRRPWWNHAAIGLECDGELIAGVVYEEFTGQSIQVHVAAERGRHWATPGFLWACAYYPFVQLGVKYLYGLIDSSNMASRRLSEHLGFKQKTLLEGAATGGDLIIYVMQPEDCRFLEVRHVE